MFGPRRVFRIREFCNFEAFVETSVEPRPDDQLLLAARVLATVMLPSLKARDGTLVHKVVPASDCEAWYVHLCKVERTVFVLPIVIEVRMHQPFLKQPIVVFRIATVASQRFKACRTIGAADAIPFMKQAESCIDHVLCRQMRRLSDCKKVLSIAGLRTAERPDLAGTPWLSSQPFTGVVSILQFAPAECSISNPCAFGFMRSAIVHHRDNITGLGKSGGGLASSRAADISISLLEQRRPRSLPLWKIEIRRKMLPVTHWDHLMFLCHRSQVNILEGIDFRLKGQRTHQHHQQGTHL